MSITSSIPCLKLGNPVGAKIISSPLTPNMSAGLGKSMASSVINMCPVENLFPFSPQKDISENPIIPATDFLYTVKDDENLHKSNKLQSSAAIPLGILGVGIDIGKGILEGASEGLASIGGVAALGIGYVMTMSGDTVVPLTNVDAIPVPLPKTEDAPIWIAKFVVRDAFSPPNVIIFSAIFRSSFSSVENAALEAVARTSTAIGEHCPILGIGRLEADPLCAAITSITTVSDSPTQIVSVNLTSFQSVYSTENLNFYVDSAQTHYQQQLSIEWRLNGSSWGHILKLK